MRADAVPKLATVAALREAFDRAFAEAPNGVDGSPREDLLAITVADDPYAVPLAEVAGLFADRRIAPLPGAPAELRGLAALRGAVLPVYDLRALLGYPGGDAPRWLIVTAHAPVALAFDRLDGHLRVTRDAVMAARAHPAGAGRGHVRDVVRAGGAVSRLVDIRSVLETIAVLAGKRNRPEESRNR